MKSELEELDDEFEVSRYFGKDHRKPKGTKSHEIRMKQGAWLSNKNKTKPEKKKP